MNEELLINLVQGYKELYDLQDPHYDDQQRRDNIWKEIGDIMKESGKYHCQVFISYVITIITHLYRDVL